MGELVWDAWTALNADEIIQFVRGTLLGRLARLNGSPLAKTIAGIFSDESVGDQTVIRSVPVCASGYNLKDVLDIINSIHFESRDDVFTITRFYEDLLAQMGNENRIAGEFHTPRPVIKFMVDVIDPQIGETIYDPASGSCGFPRRLVSICSLRLAPCRITTFYRIRIFDVIPADDIVSICLPYHGTVFSQYKEGWQGVEVCVEPNYFGPRMDYRYWSEIDRKEG